MKSSRTKACQLLIKFNYAIYIPISSDEVLIIEKDGKLLKCLTKTAIIKTDGSPVVNIANRSGSKRFPIDPKNATYLIAVSDTQIWLLPLIDILEYDALRLGAKWNHCLLGYNKADNNVKKKRITTAARRAIKKMTTEMSGIEKEKEDAKMEREKLENVFNN